MLGRFIFETNVWLFSTLKLRFCLGVFSSSHCYGKWWLWSRHLHPQPVELTFQSTETSPWQLWKNADSRAPLQWPQCSTAREACQAPIFKRLVWGLQLYSYTEEQYSESLCTSHPASDNYHTPLGSRGTMTWKQMRATSFAELMVPGRPLAPVSE